MRVGQALYHNSVYEAYSGCQEAHLAGWLIVTIFQLHLLVLVIDRPLDVPLQSVAWCQLLESLEDFFRHSLGRGGQNRYRLLGQLSVVASEDRGSFSNTDMAAHGCR